MKKLYLLFILFTTIVNAQEQLITTWQVNAGDLTIKAPISFVSGDFTVDFGDGTISSDNTTHTYSAPGIYTVSIVIEGYWHLTFHTPENAQKILTVEQWGNNEWYTMENAFSGCSNLTLNAADTPNLSYATSMKGVFTNCTSLNQSINNWDVSHITNMSLMFSGASSFNQPLDNWDVSNVTNMSGMFDNATSFNQSLGNWDVSGVTDMSSIFYNAESFNQPLDSWNVGNVTDISKMFYGAILFNQSLNDWDVSAVKNMSSMFYNALAFNEPIDNWDVSNVINMSSMFYNADSFNQPLNNWDVSNVKHMPSMFYDAEIFNQPLGNWNVSQVINMSEMFSQTIFNQPIDSWNIVNVTNMSEMFFQSDFNQPLNNWNVPSVDNMSGMFSGSSFNHPLNDWDVSNVTYMSYMFADTDFNQPLNDWNVFNVTNMSGMFENASGFNQDISNWNFGSNIILDNMVSGTALDIQNYDALLLQFLELGLENKIFTANMLHYCDEETHNLLTYQSGWTIEGDSLGAGCPSNRILGNVIYDVNANGCNTEDPSSGKFLVNSVNGQVNSAVIPSNGEYNFRVMDNSYTVSLLNVPDYFTVTPPSSNVEFNDFGNEEEINFCLTANQNINDLNIRIIPITGICPESQSQSLYRLVVENIGSQPITGAIAGLTFDASKQSFASASQTPVTGPDILNFNLGTLSPLENKTIDITLDILIQTPAAELSLTANVSYPSNNDYTPGDNIYNLKQAVDNDCSWNTKNILQGEQLYIEQTEDYLDYIIRFENSWSETANTVRIVDELHENLDWTTFRPVTASHPYKVNIINGRKLEFVFENINLPGQETDENGSKGFVAYKIKTIDDIAIGDYFEGPATIYFDNYMPITTPFPYGYAHIMGSLDISKAKVTGLAIYPNPTNSILYLQTQEGMLIENITIYSLQGSEVINIKGQRESINVQDLSAGIYLLNIQTNQGMSQHRLIKK